jgi:hypothetical protein
VGLNHHPDQSTRIDAIAFDLDMTLVDSRPVSQRALERLVSEHGAHLDIETLMSAYGVRYHAGYRPMSTACCSGRCRPRTSPSPCHYRVPTPL